jgi:hypothetical protein
LDTALRRGLDRLSPQQTRRLAHRFRRACNAAERDGMGMPEMCYALRGTCDWRLLGPEMAVLTTVDIRADSFACPAAPVIVAFRNEFCERERIRRSRPWFSTTGPPPREKESRPQLVAGAADGNLKFPSTKNSRVSEKSQSIFWERPPLAPMQAVSRCRISHLNYCRILAAGRFTAHRGTSRAAQKAAQPSAARIPNPSVTAEGGPPRRPPPPFQGGQ